MLLITIFFFKVSNFARKYVNEDNVKGTLIVAAIFKELLADQLLLKYSLRGIKRKDVTNLRFDVYINLIDAIYCMYTFAKNKLKRIKPVDVPSMSILEGKISEYIRHAKERIQKKAGKAAKNGSNVEANESDVESVE